ncbi:MAG: PLP-dependent aminotransferase family protein [Polaromonas sp.]
MHNIRDALWARLFELPKDSTLPLQLQLRSVVVQAILGGRLAPGAALPSSRDLASMLTLSRNTVSASYQQLVDEGFLQARPRHGVFVSNTPRQLIPDVVKSRPEGVRRPPNWSARMVRTLSDLPTLSKPEAWRNYPFPFIYGSHDAQLFPTEDFRECCVRSLARAQLPHWTPDFETDDVADLIEQIRLRLLPKRGVFALKDEILVTVGAQQAFHLLAELLFDRRTRLGFEEPGYPHARNTFFLREPQCIPINVDSEGAFIDALPALDYIFVTPSHQSPTTFTLSLERRQRLLQLAEQQDFIVIEDDYEAENLYEGNPMPALKSLDRCGRVIYVGSLSKSLSPALRLGYIVAPSAVIAELRVLRHAMVRHPSAFLQHAYALFLSLGHHESHARRVNNAMQERVQLAAQGLGRHMADFDFHLPRGGASLWVHGPAWLDGNELALTARHHGVLIEPGDVFFVAPPYPCPFFRLRLSSIAPDQIDAGLKALSAAVTELAQARGVTRNLPPRRN